MISTIKQRVFLVATLLFLGVSLTGSVSANPLPPRDSTNGYVGSHKCQSCHTDEYQQWQLSDHSKSMQTATSEFVLGDFSDITVTFHGVTSRLYRNGDSFLIDTQNAEGQLITYPILYTFGFYPLQQYLVETGSGHIQALNIAWDSRDKTTGGQRWFHLREDQEITSQDLFFWSRHFQNWNNRCSDCHSTNVDRNYDPKTHSYNTTFAEINVACEACHGPAQKHIEIVAANDQRHLDGSGNTTNQNSIGTSGFTQKAQPPLSWKFTPGESIAQPHGKKNDDNINMCGDCHSLRTQLVPKAQGHEFNDSSLLQLITMGPYFADGQIQQETFVLGSFLQSKMYEQGVTCANCHNPHSGKVFSESNKLCSQCHKPEVFDTQSHHHHPQNSSGAACVNCHMPERTYMQVDDRRDHSFTIPRPDLSIALSVPDACTTCHENREVDKQDGNLSEKSLPTKDAHWAATQLERWGVINDQPHWATLNHRAFLTDPLVTRGITNIAKADELPDLIRASLLQQLAPFPSRVSITTAHLSMQDPNPLVRRAAAASLRNASAQIRWQALRPFLNDDSRSVRFQIANTLADLLNQLPTAQQPELSGLIDEYRDSLLVSRDSPAGQLSLAELAVRLGNSHAAKQHYLHALLIEPNYVPALLNLADYYRQAGQSAKSEELLNRALTVAPDSGASHYSYGLMLIRKKEYQNALGHLKSAVQKLDASPGYAYAYAVALEHQGELTQAIQALADANDKWPNQYDLLVALVLYCDQAGDTTSAYAYLSSLSALAPHAPKVRELVNKFRPDFYSPVPSTTNSPISSPISSTISSTKGSEPDQPDTNAEASTEIDK